MGLPLGLPNLSKIDGSMHPLVVIVDPMLCLVMQAHWLWVLEVDFSNCSRPFCLMIGIMQSAKCRHKFWNNFSSFMQ